jgi:8-oxo-dGTP pyrophosphatase MutT (NUDIX family)
MKQHKILYTDKWFDVVDLEGHVGLKNKHMSVAVLPYTTDSNGLIAEIGLLHEFNRFRENDYCDTLITGTIDYEDDSLFFTAVRELREEGGFTLPEDATDRWIFLGPIYVSKNSDQIIPVFAVDVTGLPQQETTGDGSEKELKSRLEMVGVGNGIASDESLVLAAFVRLFNYMYAKAIGQ